jgi:ferritin-like metal-binding protein YciE
MEVETLRDLYVHELKDLYSAEQQLIKALPKMSKAAKNRSLAAAFNQHLEQTKRQAKRLEQILKAQDESTRGPKCEGMEGLISEGDETISNTDEGDVRDAGLIAAAQRVEHYEIAGYGCARTYAQLLRDTKGARLLETTLKEEGATDKKLTKLAKSAINLKARKTSKKIEKQQANGQRNGGVVESIKRMVVG